MSGFIEGCQEGYTVQEGCSECDKIILRRGHGSRKLIMQGINKHLQFLKNDDEEKYMKSGLKCICGCRKNQHKISDECDECDNCKKYVMKGFRR